MKTQLNAGAAAGRYRMQIVRPDGTVRHDTDWFDNLITNIGLNRFGTASVGPYCRVGSGSTAPLVTDESLVAQIGATTAVSPVGSVAGAAASPPYHAWYRRTFRFAAGVAAGNISEVGIGWATTGATLFSRALIVDAEGDPTTITVLSDEVLDVTYELRLYAPTVDQTFDIVIGGVTYACVARAATVQSWVSNWLDWSVIGASTNLASVVPYAGPIGTVLQAPSGSTASGASAVPNAYANNSMTRTAKATFSLTAGNVVGGIGALKLDSTAAGQFQIGITPKIPKDDTKVLTIDFAFSWGRYTP